MLIEASQQFIFWKWVMLIFFAAVTLTESITTGVALALGVGGVWLSIMLVCTQAVLMTCIFLMEALGLNEWAQDCKQVAGDYIMLGRRIESQKRIPRAQRYETGIKFANAAR